MALIGLRIVMTRRKGVFTAGGAAGFRPGRAIRAACAACAAGSLLLQGCASMNVGYEAETTVWPADRPGEYIVAFRIYEKPAAGADRLVSSPRITVEEGRPGEVTLGDEHSSIKCGALVGKSGAGAKATVRVRIMRGDRKVWTARQTVTFSSGPDTVQPDGNPASSFN